MAASPICRNSKDSSLFSGNNAAELFSARHLLRSRRPCSSGCPRSKDNVPIGNATVIALLYLVPLNDHLRQRAGIAPAAHEIGFPKALVFSDFQPGRKLLVVRILDREIPTAGECLGRKSCRHTICGKGTAQRQEKLQPMGRSEYREASLGASHGLEFIGARRFDKLCRGLTNPRHGAKRSGNYSRVRQRRILGLAKSMEASMW